MISDNGEALIPPRFDSIRTEQDGTMGQIYGWLKSSGGSAALGWTDISGKVANGSYTLSVPTLTANDVVATLGIPQVWSKQQSSAVATLTDAATINWDVSASQRAKVTLGGNRTMAAVTNAVEGTTYTLWLLQDATGSRTISSWTTSGAGSFDFGASGAPTLTTAANKGDMLCFEAMTIGGTLKLRYMGIAKGFA